MIYDLCQLSDLPWRRLNHFSLQYIISHRVSLLILTQKNDGLVIVDPKEIKHKFVVNLLFLESIIPTSTVCLYVIAL